MTDIDTLKTRLKAAWMAGDFGKIAASNASGGVEFINRLDLKPGTRVLDVACGTGNLSFPAAHTGAKVTGIDIATNLLDQARSRAKEEGIVIQFDEGDAENLPYGDATFDVIVSMFGAMFAPRPEKVAAELMRVCRSGGKLALATWIPDGFIGKIFKTTGKHVPPPPGIPSPLLWGDEATVRERLSDGIADLQFTRRVITFTFPFPVSEVVDYWRLYYGPTQRAFEALDSEGQAALRYDLNELWLAHNLATDGTIRSESEYLEVVASRS